MGLFNRKKKGKDLLDLSAGAKSKKQVDIPIPQNLQEKINAQLRDMDSQQANSVSTDSSGTMDLSSTEQPEEGKEKPAGFFGGFFGGGSSNNSSSSSGSTDDRVQTLSDKLTKFEQRLELIEKKIERHERGQA